MLITIGLLCFLTSINYSQSLQNSNFEKVCSELSSEQCAWVKSWGSDNCCSIDQNGERSFLKLNGKTENSVSFVEQEITYPVQQVFIMELEAMIKTNEVKGKGAGLNVTVHDESGQVISTKDMGGFYSNKWIKESTDWTKTKINLILPPGSNKIKVGAILYGKGEALYDSFKIQFKSLNDRQANDLSKIYISAAIDIIQKNSLYKDSVDYKKLETLALQIAGDAKTYSDCYLAIEYLLETLRPYGDNHSFFMSNEENELWKNDSADIAKIDLAEIKKIDDTGYILVPPFHSGNEDLMIQYAEHIHREMSRLMSPDVKGWIVDLRQNTGGNMEPMIVGLGSLLDEGKIGSLLDVNGNHEHWYYKNGTYFWEDEKGIAIKKPFVPDRKLPIVVLTGAQTGSSGEIVAISFIGNSNTIFMGGPTWGLTTGNGEFELPDGSFMFLASTKMVDRNGKVYTSTIKPDIQIDASKVKDDVLINFAISWIMRRY